MIAWTAIVPVSEEGPCGACSQSEQLFQKSCNKHVVLLVLNDDIGNSFRVIRCWRHFIEMSANTANHYAEILFNVDESVAGYTEPEE